MKILFVICVVLVSIVISEAAPKKGYKIYKNKPSNDAAPVAAAKSSDGDVAAILSTRRETTTTTTPAPPPVIAVESVSPTPEGPEVVRIPDDTVSTTKKSKLGNKPFGEPTPLPDAADPSAPVFPPKPEVEASLSPANESAQAAAPENIPPSNEASAVAVPPQGPPPPPPAPSATPETVKNGTTPEEDDSSSEEDGADEEDDGRTLISKNNKKAKSVKIPVSRNRPPPPEGRAGPPKNPPLKYDLIINGFVTEDGQVLVPLSTYNKYFHDGESTKLPPVYAITRDESQGSSGASAVVSEEVEADSDNKSSEEKVSKKPNPESESVENQNQGGSSEETEKATSASAESEEKEKPVESEEIESTSSEVEEKPKVPSPGTTPVFRPPPLQAIPARLPTDEDDEDEAGRYLDQQYAAGYLPPFDYEDDEPHYGFNPEPVPYFGY